MITVEEAAKKLGVSRTTVFKYIADGHLGRLKRAYDRRTYVDATKVEGLRSGLNAIVYQTPYSPRKVELTEQEGDLAIARLFSSGLTMHREALGLSVSEFAAAVGVAPADVERAEAGDVDLVLRILLQWRSVARAGQAKSKKARR